MSSRVYVDLISIETRTDTSPASWALLTRRRCAVDVAISEIRLPWDSELSGLEWQRTRVIWHSRGGDKLLNLSGVRTQDGRLPLIIMTLMSEQLETDREQKLLVLSGEEVEFR